MGVIEALRFILKEEKVVKLAEKAFNIVSVLPEFLEFAKMERSKAQYYSRRPKKFSVREAEEFMERIVEPFIKAMVELIKHV